ncbi:hypothetical protein ABIA30_004838 [Mycobacterium sp. MAA66]
MNKLVVTKDAMDITDLQLIVSLANCIRESVSARRP